MGMVALGATSDPMHPVSPTKHFCDMLQPAAALPPPPPGGRSAAAVPLWQRINWLFSSIVVIPPAGLVIGSAFVPLQRNTFVLAVILYIVTGVSITAGYHRLFSHRAYCAAWPVEVALLAWGAAAFEGSARWWSTNHRAHHRYVDTDADPHSVHRGFWHAHIGWIMLKQDTKRFGRVNVSDLKAHRGITFQHNYYFPIALFFGFVLPLAVASYGWGDVWGSLVYACFGRIFFVQQATFSVNSLAHTIGTQSYSTGHTSFDSLLTALITFGEGYHNYHHEFPHDFRNGIRWYHYDPTKWVIGFLSWFGLCFGLESFPANEVEKAKLQMKQQELDVQKAAIDWGKPLESLGCMGWDGVAARVESGDIVVVIDGVVHEVTDFAASHPGGERILQFWNGRDATAAFHGETYRHSKAARNLLANFRVARVVEKLA